jgi:hypothetical protein
VDLLILVGLEGLEGLLILVNQEGRQGLLILVDLEVLKDLLHLEHQLYLAFLLYPVDLLDLEYQ